MITTPPTSRRALQLIAAFEALKGLAALAVLVGVLDLMHHDMRAIAMALIGRFGLDPEGHYSSLMLHYAELLPQANQSQIVFVGLGYAAIRLAEAYGLWMDLVWGEYLGAVSGAIYIPFEVSHFFRQPDITSFLIVIFNCGVVIYLTRHIYRKKKAPAEVYPLI
jgi:uncharacterized membrane protein (DUF2068 family)